ncbi:ATP-binding protein [Streptomyces sp. NPDC058045]|uniref:ATP-binding protein n=1 Tax=Streptomyces sp. NPDC058045 TaxID=3346311 RepID=UPI0036ED4C40
MTNAHRLSARYPRSKASVGRAREFARRFAEGAALDGTSDDLVQIVSELVANAIVHGRTARDRQVALMLDMDSDRVRVEVRDVGDGMPRKRCGERDLAVSGRGLEMVEILSSAWGVTEQVIGKTVWAEIRIAGEGGSGTCDQ